MSTDWNQKLAWVLRDLPDPKFDLLQLSGHRSNLLGGTDVEVDVGPRADWLESSADRVPFPKGKAGARVQVDWGEHPEVTHPVSTERFTTEAIDLEAIAKVAGGLVEEASKRFDGDARRLLSWMCRYLPERLASAEGGPGPIASCIPADPRLPSLSVWQRMRFDAALAGATPSPSFLVVQVLPAAESLNESVSLADLWTGSSLAAELTWQAMLPIVEELGPEAILSPSIHAHPRVDAWLAEQGITASQEGPTASRGAQVAGDLPSVFVALVPSDRARELGEACKQRFDQAWVKMAERVREHLVKLGWADKGDEAWTSIWSRQSARAWEVPWTAVGWGEDSTGAGSLLPKQDVTMLEKWARVQEDASGLDDPWPGIYFGLWCAASLAAASARRTMGTLSVLCEPDRPCTACGHREALNGGSADVQNRDVARFWEVIASKADGVIQPKEALCAVCATRRMGAAAGVVDVPEALSHVTGETGCYALVLFEVDDAALLLRGGKELKHVATLGDNVHSELAKPFIKRARSHTKEILETPAPLGPARQMGVLEAQNTFLSNALREVLDQFGALAVHASDRELIIVAKVDDAYPLTCALRERMHKSFVHVSTQSGQRLAMHIGSKATSSALIALVPPDQVVGPLVQDCRQMLHEVVVEGLGGDGLVVLQRRAGVEERTYAAHWGELGTSVDALLSALPDPSKRARLADVLLPVVPALSNSDLDKASSTARPALVTNVLLDAGFGEATADVDAMARAVCQLVDHRVRLSNGAEESHALDGLRIVTSLRGVDR